MDLRHERRHWSEISTVSSWPNGDMQWGRRRYSDVVVQSSQQSQKVIPIDRHLNEVSGD
jgi:hypothetical protein